VNSKPKAPEIPRCPYCGAVFTVICRKPGKERDKLAAEVARIDRIAMDAIEMNVKQANWIAEQAALIERARDLMVNSLPHSRDAELLEQWLRDAGEGK
jgi:hypothetical protein